MVIYLAAPREAGWLEWHRLECLFASLVLLMHMRPVPVIVFHEDYTEEDKRMLRAAVAPHGNDIRFEQVDFTGHEADYVNRRPGERVGEYGYVMMCRFFSGIMQRHPLLQPYSHYMRLDDDSYIVGRIEDSTVNRMLSADYSYNSVFSDPHEDLWAFSLDFMQREGITPASGYREAVPYTNFHVASLRLWRHPVIERYVDAIEAERGCLRHRWDDAQIGGVIAFALAPALGFTVNLEEDFPYRHNQQCVHKGEHTPYCVDGRIPPPVFHWGPPPQIVKGTRR